jgi:topoisomerase IV subunit B
MAIKQATYNESSIRVLKGLEPVRERPGMYTRTDNPLHIIQEVLDNASDEALAGFTKNIDVILHVDGSVSVKDNGRGIPVGMHPEEKVPVVEIVFTRLHAGGKFDKKSGGAYSFAGGLHGVGVSVTNALSTRLEVTVEREGGQHRLVFAQGGNVAEPLKKIGNTKTTGTLVRAWPDPKYFDAGAVPVADLQRLLRSKAVLLSGVAVTLTHEKTGERNTWLYKDGLRGYLQEALDGAQPLIPYFEGERFAESGHDTFAEGEGAQWVVAWTEEGAITRESYVNLIPTPAGGTHEAGLREGLFGAIKGFVEMHSLLPKGVKLLPEDVFARASFVLSAKVLDPQFQGQVKERLNSRDAVRLVATMTKPPLELWLNEHVEFGKKLAKVEKKKGSGVAVLPGKLTDCESDDTSRTEVFLVEGDSAGGSAKMGRNKEFQAILPLRGKVLNSWETERDRLFANNEIHDIAVAIGVDPHGATDTPDLSGLRYGKICILSDADVDGSHIQVLLLTLFFKHFPKLIDAGHIFLARTPLYRLDVPAAGKRPLRKLYCLDDEELEIAIDKLKKEGVREGAWEISRFKGLGEMMPAQLWETTMNPDTRRLLGVQLGQLDFLQTTDKMNMLMGKGEAQARRAWLEEHGNEVEVDV